LKDSGSLGIRERGKEVKYKKADANIYKIEREPTSERMR
jgi:hypothetical protein